MAQHPLRGISIAAAGLVGAAALVVVTMNVFEGVLKLCIAGAGAAALGVVVLLHFWGDDSESKAAPEAGAAPRPAAAPVAAAPTSPDSSEEVMNTVRLARVLKKLAELQTAHDRLAAEHTGCQADRAESIAAHEAAMARSQGLETDAFAMRKEIEELRASLSAAGVAPPAESGAAQAAAEEARLHAQHIAELERERDELREECGRALTAERSASSRAETAEQERAKALGQVADLVALRAEIAPLRATAARAAEVEAAHGTLRAHAAKLEENVIALRRRADAAEASVKQLEAARSGDEAATATVQREQQAVRERVRTLDAELADARRRADAAEASVKHLETTRGYETAAAEVGKREQHALRERATRLEADLTEAKRRGDAAEATVRKLESTRGTGDAAAVREQQALRERVTRLEADLADAKRRGDAAEETVRKLETSRGDAGAATEAAQREQQALVQHVARLQTDLAAAKQRGDAAEASVRRFEAARNDETAAAAGAQREHQSLRERMTRLESDLADAKRRGDAAQTALAELDAARGEMEHRHAVDATHVKSLTAELQSQAERAALLAAEVEALHATVASAEDAVRAVLHELGADAGQWPLTVVGVTQAIAPLTLLALGEDTPGWKPNPDADTLAAAIVHLAQDAADRRDQIARLSAAVARQPAARR